jgi:hypothetical protein
MYFPDLSNETQILRGGYVRAIGWLDSSNEFPVADPDIALVRRLELFRSNSHNAVEALFLWVSGGFHRCQFCENHGDGVNFAVPHEGLLYVCPGMVAHYVEAHSYSPPREFVEALFQCPDPGTAKYFELCFRFNERMSEKRPLLRQFLARAMSTIDRASGMTLTVGPGDACSVWLRDHGTPERQVRLQVLLEEHTGRFLGRVGHSPPHDDDAFVVDEVISDLTLEVLQRVVGTRFRPYRRPTPADAHDD